MKDFHINPNFLAKVISIFDENITNLQMQDEHNFKLSFCGETKTVSDKELIYMLSSGTTKGMLYKDKSVNKRNATLIFTTHYCELLDLFNRQDNIYIAKSDNKVYLTNMYEGFNIRPELLKSKQFYNNVFETAVNYDELMQLKKELKAWKNS